ncbi:MAG: CRISPR-associated endonuclease Cas2 [Burkholderiales bacterium]|jgi:CRISPR-associated protein Cas2|nr:CRISPR-associated endonuclease Cas2 [Burkholderiales bacterium]
MMVLVSYDVSTTDSESSRRLRHIAKACKDYGQRVQYSVFEIEVDPAQWIALRQRLMDIIDQKQDSLRFYFLGKNWQNRVEHIGAKSVPDLHGILIF